MMWMEGVGGRQGLGGWPTCEGTNVRNLAAGSATVEHGLKQLAAAARGGKFKWRNVEDESWN
jgi:hypothetical protein